MTSSHPGGGRARTQAVAGSHAYDCGLACVRWQAGSQAYSGGLRPPAATHLRESELRVDTLLDFLDRGHVADGAVQVVVLHDHGRLVRVRVRVRVRAKVRARARVRVR
eukprot:scaffold13658_cov57-Phaeocystis_antarctica.AAC.1